MRRSTTEPPLRITTSGRRLPFIVALPLALLAMVLGLDIALRHVSGVAATGLLDEPAHLATAALALLAARPWRWLSRHPGEAAVTLAAAVLIDLDHVPLYAGVPHIDSGGRPYTHSLATVMLLLLVATLLPATRRRWVVAVAAGVVLHLLRDLATGPGVTLFWLASSANVLLPYSFYAALLVAFAAVATARGASTCCAGRIECSNAPPGGAEDGKRPDDA